MSDRKNLKISRESYELLCEEKQQYETWDGLMVRLLEDNDG